MKNRTKSLACIMVAVALLLSMSVVAFAYSGTFSFQITNGVTGSYKHTLVANKAVVVKSRAETYVKVNGGTTTNYRSYRVGIQRKGSLLMWGTNTHKADGSSTSYTYAASRIIAGTYRAEVNVTNASSTYEIVGSGTIKQ